ncbi:dr1-associated corepressor homolog [Armigeres subalbatus]|uniref:dr1-associated corepressor homolog n=1 Tax=Armigeres subalbatus TaxID=124917 RepID=UPI002ED1CDCD
MPSKKKKYNARFPAGRIKKIMQTDEEVGKVAQAVPVIISRTLELFVESLLTKTLRITNARNAKTLSPSHMKQCIISESRFDFLRDLVKNIPDIGVNEEQLSGSEAGYGNEAGASPASTSTSSSSNGGGGAGHMHVSETNSAASGLLQRSESYTPSSSTSYASALPIAPQLHIPTQQQQSQAQPSSQKRPFSQANSLNFYKEISLDDSSSTTSSGREPPPKLTRLHSAPAASATTTNAIPIKIDILPASAPLLSSSAATGSNNSQPAQLKSNNGTGGASSNSFKITYKIAPSSNPPTPTAIEQPVIKLDYSNLKLPLATADQSKPASSSATSSTSSQRHLQPTIKIDLSNISSFKVSPGQVQTAPLALIAGSGRNQQQVPSTPTTASTPSTPLSAMSLASSSSMSSGSSLCGGSVGSTSTSGGKNPYIFQQQSATAGFASTSSGSAAPLYSSVSSAIPGMDEDYDDI